MKKLYFGLVALLAFALTACPSGPAVSATGTWNGKITNASNAADFIFVQYVLTDSSGTVTGTFTVCTALGSGCSATTFPVTGTRNNTTLNLTTTVGSSSVTANGTINGNAFTGTGVVGSIATTVTLNR